MGLTVLCAVALLAAEPAPKEHGVDGIGLPLISYNSDLGLGLGAVGGAYFYSPGYAPYRHSIGAQVFFSSRGAQSHWVRYDGPRLIGPFRLEARVEWRRELYGPFFGAGNLSAPGVIESPTREELRFAFARTSPAAWLRLRRPLGQTGLHAYGGYGFRYTSVRTYPGTQLEKDAPLGLAGGATGGLQLGLQRDTRNDENDPSRGGLEEVALRAFAPPTGSRYTFAGITLSERRFVPLGSPRLVLAGRVMFDLLVGQVPFFEWTTLGGTQLPEGIGGMSSVRGVPRNRYAGQLKVLGNAELRYNPISFSLWGAPVDAGGLLFVDLGRVWQPEVPDGPWYRWHPGVGAGLRVSRRAAVLRLDFGVATESWRKGLYVTFGHLF